MDSLSSIDTSLYSGLVEGFAPKSLLPIQAVQVETASDSNDFSRQNYSNDDFELDLSNYYNEVKPEDLLTKTGKNLVQSLNALDNAMVNALRNGYSVQDACNIKLAEIAYKANAYVFDVASEISTFELKV